MAAIWEVFYVVDWGCDEVYVYRFLNAEIVLDYEIGDGDNEWTGWMRTGRNRRFLMPLHTLIHTFKATDFCLTRSNTVI